MAGDRIVTWKAAFQQRLVIIYNSSGKNAVPGKTIPTKQTTNLRTQILLLTALKTIGWQIEDQDHELHLKIKRGCPLKKVTFVG